MSNKLILFDIDGTIISYKGKTHIPEQTTKAIKLLKEGGHHIAFATGRSLLTTQKLMMEMGITTAILHNGAQIIIENETVQEKKISKRTATRVCSMLSDTDYSVFAFDGSQIFAQNMAESAKYYLEEQVGAKNFIQPLHASKNSLFELYIFAQDEQQPIRLPNYRNLIFHRNLSLLAVKGVSKGAAMLELAHKLQIPAEETIALGDGLNDIEMLQTAGLGIAVGGACDALKNVSDLVIGDIETGGIFDAFAALNLISGKVG